MTPVTLIIIDGLRPDAIRQARCPSLEWLMRNGSFTLKAHSVMPTFTLPCHTSIFYSLPAEQHGVLTNYWTPAESLRVGLFDIIDTAGLKAAMFYNWEPLRDLSRPGCLAFSYFCDNADDPDGDQVLADEAAQYLSDERPAFAFVYLGTLDNVGHSRGWLSAEYLRQLERVDLAVGTVLAAVGSSGAVIVHSDHGGHDHEHGTDALEDLTIPWLAAGPGIRRKYDITQSVSLLDTAPTIARLLNLTLPSTWQGHCIEEILVAPSKRPHLTISQPAFALMVNRYWGEY
ncbi:MAG TPA: alkaline phosphatase family protein [Anaerolineae bacterium]|nr:alkaline phosphatase family protein [Anaerolineae bacterium]